jgi:peptidoglycan hydrolase CwlO-like protein
MRNKPIERNNVKTDTVETLQQENVQLQIKIDKLKITVLKLETKVQKQEQKIIRLQTENEKLKEEIKSTPGLMQTVVAALKKFEHDKPPIK